MKRMMFMLLFVFMSCQFVLAQVRYVSSPQQVKSSELIVVGPWNRSADTNPVATVVGKSDGSNITVEVREVLRGYAFGASISAQWNLLSKGYVPESGTNAIWILTRSTNSKMYVVESANGVMPIQDRDNVMRVIASVNKESGKKGACIAAHEDFDWKKRLSLANVRWFYTWNHQPPPGIPANVEFVPMIWGLNDWGRMGLQRIENGKARTKYRHLLGFNEPDGADQANLSVEKALGEWQRLMSSGLRLGSPAAVHADREWLQKFMTEVEAKRYKVDFIAVHWYGEPRMEVFFDFLERTHKLYNRPIWITEFAVADWSAGGSKANQHSPEFVADFMTRALSLLEGLNYVERYAWFSAPQDHAKYGTSALFKKDGTLTDLGKLYAAFPTTANKIPVVPLKPDIRSH
ncbi:MAG: hypothetical protein C0404_01790 [Verrucomicrobia bacterium]|nr:hypothetical protein [Verrucomicrobiota bacterium]